MREATSHHVRRVSSLLAPFIVALAVVLGAKPASTQEPRWGREYLPNVAVVDQDRRQLKFYDDLIKGKIVVISFVYTSCNSICPLTIARLAEVKDTLGDAMGRDIFFVSVSIDPIPDTPEKLKEYANAFKIGPGWSFITGDPEHIDLIRYKLGERSGKAIAQHKSEVLMFNDVTGEWSRSSVFADLGVLTMEIRGMDPEWRRAQSLEVKSDGDRLHDGVKSSGVADRPGQALFLKACAACHTVGGGDKLGPDLSGLTVRRGLDWITRYMVSPDKVRAAHDPIAQELRQRYPNIRMPKLGLSDADAADVISYIESAKPTAASVAERPETSSGK